MVQPPLSSIKHFETRIASKEVQIQEETMRVNPKELNPYLKDGRGGYPSENFGPQILGKRKDLEAPLVGDGGLSWRSKALKRAKELAEREGRKLDTVVEERWGSLAEMAASVSGKWTAQHVIRDRKCIDSSKLEEIEEEKHSDSKRKATDRGDYLKDVSNRDIGMKAPDSTDTLSWKKRRAMCVEEQDIFHEATLASNKFQNDGNFLETFKKIQQHQGAVQQECKLFPPKRSVDDEGQIERSDVDVVSSLSTEGMSANRLAAKAVQLQLQGKTKEADALLHKKDDEEEELESKRRKQKASKDVGGKEAKRAIQLITQEERCQFCFNNPSRPKHLTISIANFCYLMLPPWEPLTDGHCLLVPTQHDSSSRNVDENVWQELRNYKKCLIQMFAKQDKEVLFMETIINLAQQCHHCLVECIPLHPGVAKQAPLYFKKAIDEAEDEWSQHDAKKLIDTSGKGLRACIPKNFPYFHVEFGLHAGFVHVIDYEREFRSDFGQNVVIGMLKLPEEEMHRRRKQQSYDQQKKAVVEFRKAWDPFDWTRMLD